MKKNRRIYFTLLLIVAVTIAAAFVCMPNGPYLKIGKKVIFNKTIKLKEGLDLQGGAHLVYSVDLSKTDSAKYTDALNSLQKVVENRVNPGGAAETTVQYAKVGGGYRLTVELPGVKDVNQAINLIGKTASLEFKELGTDGASFVSLDPKLTGSDLKSAGVSFDSAGKPQIDLIFNADGAAKFEAVTGRNIGKPIGIFLDDNLVSYPNVNQKISGGNAQITGTFTYAEAKDLATQLNAGALPVQIKLIQQQAVGATLGRDSVHRSIYAGVLGIIFVSLFMIAYYRGLGIFSTIGLGLYAVFMIALIKLSQYMAPFNITLSMGGIAGLILSVGMSMETDVLVFERIREELRNGRTFATSISLGFSRAWPSIRDSNAVSVIIALILLIMGSGTVRGFALVLVLGIVVGLTTTFVGTKTFLTIASRFKLAQRYGWYAVKAPKEAE